LIYICGMNTEQPTIESGKVAAPAKQRKTKQMVSKKTGKVYFTAIREPAPKFRGQRFTLLKDDIAQIRIELTESQYKQVQEAAKDVSIATGQYNMYSVPEVIVQAAIQSLHVLDGNSFPQWKWVVNGFKLSDKKPAGRPVEFKNGKANVVLKMHYGIAMLLHEKYNDYCALTDRSDLPRTGPVWAAFEHGCNVIREALGEFLTVQEALAK
jgi:hypothetical protein